LLDNIIFLVKKQYMRCCFKKRERFFLRLE